MSNKMHCHQQMKPGHWLATRFFSGPHPTKPDHRIVGVVVPAKSCTYLPAHDLQAALYGVPLAEHAPAQMRIDTALMDALQAHPEWHIEAVPHEEPDDQDLWRISTGEGNDYKAIGLGVTLRKAIAAAIAHQDGERDAESEGQAS